MDDPTKGLDAERLTTLDLDVGYTTNSMGPDYLTEGLDDMAEYLSDLTAR